MLVGTTERRNSQTNPHQGQFPRRSHLPRRAVKGELQHPTGDYRLAAVQVSIERLSEQRKSVPHAPEMPFV
jgi:hypothetical protein